MVKEHGEMRGVSDLRRSAYSLRVRAHERIFLPRLSDLIKDALGIGQWCQVLRFLSAAASAAAIEGLLLRRRCSSAPCRPGYWAVGTRDGNEGPAIPRRQVEGVPRLRDQGLVGAVVGGILPHRAYLPQWTRPRRRWCSCARAATR